MTPGWFQVTLKLVLWKDQQYLALRDSHSGFGDLPGGRIGKEELFDFGAALKRELREELGTGLQASISAEPVCAFPHFVLKDRAPAIALVFEGNLISGDVALSDEHTEMLWFPFNEDPSILFTGTMLDGLMKYLRIKTSSGGPA